MEQNDKQPIVAIKCLVYNHEPYLRDCFEGFVMQQTSFPFVAIVHDDASTDKSADIIREYTEKYPDIFRPIYEIENQYSKGDGSLNQIMNAAIDATGAKYVAMCEGDDYWTDPKKLQKQVDILEKDSTLMGVVTNSSVVDFDGKLLQPNREVAKGGQGRYDLRYFIRNNNQYPTLTVVYRNSHSAEVASMFEHTLNPFLGDWTLWIILHTFGDFYFLDEVTAAYRMNPTSVTHTSNRVARAKANITICNSVADILPPEYADVVAQLRNTNWVWISLIFAYKHSHQYLRMCGAAIMALFRCPKSLFALVKKNR